MRPCYLTQIAQEGDVDPPLAKRELALAEETHYLQPERHKRQGHLRLGSRSELVGLV